MEIFAKTLLFSCNCGKMIITFVGEKGAKNYIMHESTKDIEMECKKKELIIEINSIEDELLIQYLFKYIKKLKARW